MYIGQGRKMALICSICECFEKVALCAIEKCDEVKKLLETERVIDVVVGCDGFDSSTSPGLEHYTTNNGDIITALIRESCIMAMDGDWCNTASDDDYRHSGMEVVG